MAAPGSELGWVVHFAPVVGFTPLSPTFYQKNMRTFHDFKMKKRAVPSDSTW